jgi:octaprenyl-diphosphate synthase
MTTTAAGPVTLEQLQVGLEDRLAEVRTRIARAIAADFQLISEVNAHLLQMQGKLFRPTVLLLVQDAVGSGDRRATDLAAVVELVHLATLVHDDSVDHSVLRRGMPTLNSLFTHQVSVIMGDYLYSRAMIELVRLDDLEPLRVLARVTNEMTIGEMRQLLAHDRLRYSEEEYDLLIRAKTASLLSGAAEVGALRAPAVVRQAMARFGDCLGMAFQIVDDVLDFTEPEAVTGKPSGRDLREHKVTLPLIYALPRMSSAQQHEVVALMETPEPTDGQVASVMESVASAGGLTAARRRAQEFAARAEAGLDVLPPSPARDALRASLTYVLDRRR